MIDLLLRFCDKFFSENKKSILLLLVLVTVAGSIVGYRFYKHSKEDPEFCASCHQLQDSFTSWEKSKHWKIICQNCHKMDIIEQNRLLVAFVAHGPEPPKDRAQKHGRVSPWLACEECHLREAKQGSSLRESYGHAKHVFMQGIGCEKCHSGRLHTFEPDEKACSGCHTDKLVHGLGMEGLSCLKCHSYGEKEHKMVVVGRCMKCHEKIPGAGPMAGLECFDCHKPHEKIKLQSSDCLGRCHGNESRVGQHGLHMDRAKLECLYCHKAHTWVVGEKQATNLCNKCHPIKDPRTFIY